MPSQFKLVSVGLTQPPEPDTEALPSLKLVWPAVDRDPHAYVGLRCLKQAATSTTPITAAMGSISSDLASRIVKIVGPSDPRLTFSLAVALLSDGSVIYLSSSKRFHLQPVTFVPVGADGKPIAADGSAGPSSSSTLAADGGSGSSVKIVDIAAGATHLLACDASQHAWVWGWGNEWGQFGIGSIWKSVANSNTALSNRDGGKMSASSAAATIVSSLVGDRGLSDAMLVVTMPQRIKAFGSDYGRVGVSAVAAGRYHSIFLVDNKRNVFTCGWGERGQLGQGKSVFLTPTPRSIMRLFGCAVAAVAAASNGDHTHLLLESGKVLAFGDNTTGVLGTGTMGAEWMPSRMAFHTAASVGLAGIKDLCVANVKNYTAAQAPYGTPESFLYPRRVQQITQSLSPNEPATDVLTTSATHTFMRSSEGVLYSCGQRPVKVVNPLSVINVDAIGALGRHISVPEEGLVLDEVTVETGPHAVPIAGHGFTIFMDGTGSGYCVYFVGAIVDKRGKVIVASGIKGSPSAGSLPIAFEGLVRNVFPVLGGALALVQV